MLLYFQIAIAVDSTIIYRLCKHHLSYLLEATLMSRLRIGRTWDPYFLDHGCIPRNEVRKNGGKIKTPVS